VYVPKGSRLVSASGFDAPDKKFFKTADPDSLPDAEIAAAESHAVRTEFGVDVSEEGSYTVFGGWLQLDPGTSQAVNLKYELPMNTSDILAKLDAAPEQGTNESPRGAYLMLLTSQSGKTNRELKLNISQPKNWKVAWARPTTLNQGEVLSQSSVWDRDQAVGALFSPK
jgi:hypothetical protein